MRPALRRWDGTQSLPCFNLPSVHGDAIFPFFRLQF